MGLPGRHAGSRPRLPASRAGSRGRMRAQTQAPLTTARDALPGDALLPSPRRVTLAHKSARCGAGAGSPRPHHQRIGNRQPLGAGERLSADAPCNGGGSPPPRGNHPRNTHHDFHTWATRPGCHPQKRAARGGRVPDARRPSQRREHRAASGAPLALWPPCAYARHPTGPGEQCSAPARRSVQCGATVRLCH